MRSWKAVFTVALIIVLTLSLGCSKVPGQEPTKKRELHVGGYLNYGSMYEPATLNPLLTDVLSTWEIGRLVFSGLVQPDHKGLWIADLASEVPTLQNGGISADGKTVVYHLRQDVTWHDGQPFTADDVKFTWQLMMNKKNSAFTQVGYDKISSIEIPSPYTVVIRFKEYYPEYLGLFTMVLPRHVLQDVNDMNKAAFNRNPVGTGPFKFKEWRVAEAIVLEANTAYFRGKPNLAGIIYKFIPDSNIMQMQLKSGDIDIVSNISIAQYDTVRTMNNMQVFVTPGEVWEHLDFNLDRPLFHEVAVRQAIALSIDKQAILSGKLKNIGTIAITDQSPLSWAFHPSLAAPTRDVTAAKELLTQAGWKQGGDGIFEKNGQQLRFTLTIPNGNKIREGVAALLAQQLREAGIGLEITSVEMRSFFDSILKNRKFDAVLFAWSAGSEPDHLNLFSSQSIPTALNGYEGHNYAGWRNPEVDQLVMQAKSMVNQEVSKQNYYRIQELLLQEYPIIPLYYQSNIDVVKNNVMNFKPNPTQPAGNLWNAWEWGFAK